MALIENVPNPGPAAPLVDPTELAAVLATPLELDDAGAPRCPLVFVSLDRPAAVAATEMSRVRALDRVVVGLCAGAVPRERHELRDSLTCTLVSGPAGSPAEVSVADLDAARTVITAAVRQAPRAAVALHGVLAATARLPVPEGLIVESLAYSMLLSGSEFARWRAARPLRAAGPPPLDPVLVEREGDQLRVTINRPERRNAFDRHVRDGLAEAFDLALADASIASVVLRGNGRAFCSGGDLDEFGSATELSTAHLVRLDRSIGARVHRLGRRVSVRVHGACIGAGIEIPSFAPHVVAAQDSFFQLPELAMGLIPGAGGTVSITHRVGRWRCAYLALSGVRLDLTTALDWGLVDGRS